MFILMDVQNINECLKSIYTVSYFIYLLLFLIILLINQLLCIFLSMLVTKIDNKIVYNNISQNTLFFTN